jgi:CYTH domain-containing protein
VGTEIERKFLVRDPSIVRGSTGIPYRQGYLSTDPSRTVRVRRAGEHAFLTVKGISVGASRAEFEYEVPLEDADALLAMCEQSIVVKTRYRIEHRGHTWEVDVFGGANAGLVVAEVELDATDQPVAIPDWVGDEVTSDVRYFNSALARRPFRTWTPGA